MSSFQSVGEILKNSKIKVKVDNHLMDKGICPECKSEKTSEKIYEYGWIFECFDCGFTATS